VPKVINYKLPRQQRIKKPDEFKLVYQSKQWGSSQHFSFNVLGLDSDSNAQSRLGITVSKKVSKLAVLRNRIKRQIREYYRHHSESLILTDLVISAKPSCAKASDQERQISLDQLWQKILKWQRWYLANQSG